MSVRSTPVAIALVASSMMAFGDPHCYVYELVDCCVSTYCSHCIQCVGQVSEVSSLYNRWSRIAVGSGVTRLPAAEQVLCWTEYQCVNSTIFTPCIHPFTHCIPDIYSALENRVDDYFPDASCEVGGGGGPITG